MSKLYFRYSTMGAGKSAQLLIAAHNYVERGMRPLLYNFAGDTRFGEGVIASRTGMKMESLCFHKGTDFLFSVEDEFLMGHDVDAILVDEAQFLTTEQVEDLHEIALAGIPVLCYGLRTDFLGNLFEGSQALMAHAETLEELKTICGCGRKATHVRRYVDGKVANEGAQVQIGDAEYKPLCYRCFSEAGRVHELVGDGTVSQA